MEQIVNTTSIAPSLYDRDLNLWVEHTLAQLKARDFNNLDLENLIEELEGLAGRDRRELKNRLGELLEHILKRTYVSMPENYRGWLESINKQRITLRDLLEQSPSLKPYFSQIFDKTYQDTLKILRSSYPQSQFPDQWQFSRDIESLLNVDFWE
jgi:Domain of unknown function DUF29